MSDGLGPGRAFYWCPYDHGYIRKEDAVEAPAGFVICPECLEEERGQKRLRTQPRSHWGGRSKDYAWTASEPIVTMPEVKVE